MQYIKISTLTSNSPIGLDKQQRKHMGWIEDGVASFCPTFEWVVGLAFVCRRPPQCNSFYNVTHSPSFSIISRPRENRVQTTSEEVARTLATPTMPTVWYICFNILNNFLILHIILSTISPEKWWWGTKALFCLHFKIYIYFLLI